MLGLGLLWFLVSDDHRGWHDRIASIGYLVAKVLQKLVAVTLEKLGTDRAVRSGPSGEYVQRVAPDVSPSEVIGRVVFWFVFLGALSIAISSLGIAALNDFLADVFSYPRSSRSPTRR